MKVLWCQSVVVSFPSSWLFMRVPSLHALVFIQKTFCDLFLLFLLLRNGKREEKWEGEQGEDARSMITKYNFFVHIKLIIIIKSSAHFMWTTIRFTEKLSVDCHHKGHIVLSHKTLLQQQFDGE